MILKSEQSDIVVKAEDFILPDQRSFLEALDFSRPGLERAREALGRGDLDAAVAAFIRHFRTCPMESPLLDDWSKIPRNPSFSTKAADRILAGHLDDGYNVYEVPPTGVDWHEAPLACLTRFGIFGRLLEAAWHTGDPRYAKYVVGHSLEYIHAWPIESFIGQDTRKGWRNHYVVAPPWWWCMHPNRLYQWALALPLLRLRAEVADEDLLAILRRMLQEMRFLMLFFDRHVYCGENVGAFLLVAVATIGVVMADFKESRQWQDRLACGVIWFLNEAFYPDGLYKELVTAYSSSVSNHLQRAAYVIRDHPTLQPLKERLRALLVSLVGQTRPDGFLPSFGDLQAHSLESYVMAPLADALGLSWLTSFLRKEGAVPPFRHWPAAEEKAWGGYYAMRSDWSPAARFLLVDAGPWGKAHQHCDKLSFVLSAYGANFLADPGTTTYANNEPGAFITMLNAGFLHNTITVDDVDEYIQPPGYWETREPLKNRWEAGKDLVIFEGEFDFAPLKPMRWVRRIVFIGGAYWLLQDVLTGQLPGVLVEQNFQFEPEIAVQLAGADVRALAPNGAVLWLRVLESPLVPELHKGDMTPHRTGATAYQAFSKQYDFAVGRGWVGRVQRSPIPAPAVTYVGKVQLPAVFTMALLPSAPGEPENYSSKIRSEKAGALTRWRLPAPGGERIIETSAEQLIVHS